MTNGSRMGNLAAPADKMDRPVHVDDDRTGLATRVGAVRLGGRLEEAKPAFWG